MHIYENLKKVGYEVVLSCPDDGEHFKRLQCLGYTCIPLKIDGKGKNVFKDILLIYRIIMLVKKLKPDIILSFTIKPNIYCGFVNRVLKIQVIPNITGLGSVFLKNGVLQKIVLAFYRFAFLNLKYVFLQNNDDLQLLSESKVFSKNTTAIRLYGDGVDIRKFMPIIENELNLPQKKDEVVFLYSGRLLWDKGLKELVEAFSRVKVNYPNTKLRLAGNFFFANTAAIMPEQIKEWETNLGVEYLGMLDDVRVAISAADCVVLPSFYREGVPRAIMEASSMAKVVITTDNVGCRDVIEDGITGFLCKVKDADDLALQMIKVIELGSSGRKEMGVLGRKKMKREFDQKIVVSKYFKCVADILEE